ncbi:hypothetical protein D3C71_1661970 [compost metagenome]
MKALKFKTVGLGELRAAPKAETVASLRANTVEYVVASKSSVPQLPLVSPPLDLLTGQFADSARPMRNRASFGGFGVVPAER